MYLLALRNQRRPAECARRSREVRGKICTSSSAEDFWNCFQGARSATTQQRHRIYEYIKYISGIFEKRDRLHAVCKKQVRGLLAQYHACRRWVVRIRERYWTREVNIRTISSSYPVLRSTPKNLSSCNF